MKNILLISLITITNFCFSQYSIVGSSCGNSQPLYNNPVHFGSNQYIDLKGNYSVFSAPDSILITLIDKDYQGTVSIPHLTVWKKKYSDFLKIPANADSVRHLDFLMPNSFFGDHKFQLSTNVSSAVFGIFFPEDGIAEYSPQIPISSTHYYNLLGQPITIPSGLYIREITYTDGSTRRQKLYTPAP